MRPEDHFESSDVLEHADHTLDDGVSELTASAGKKTRARSLIKVSKVKPIA